MKSLLFRLIRSLLRFGSSVHPTITSQVKLYLIRAFYLVDYLLEPDQSDLSNGKVQCNPILDGRHMCKITQPERKLYDVHTIISIPLRVVSGSTFGRGDFYECRRPFIPY